MNGLRIYLLAGLVCLAISCRSQCRLSTKGEGFLYNTAILAQAFLDVCGEDSVESWIYPTNMVQFVCLAYVTPGGRITKIWQIRRNGLATLDKHMYHKIIKSINKRHQRFIVMLDYSTPADLVRAEMSQKRNFLMAISFPSLLMQGYEGPSSRLEYLKEKISYWLQQEENILE